MELSCYSNIFETIHWFSVIEVKLGYARNDYFSEVLAKQSLNFFTQTLRRKRKYPKRLQRHPYIWFWICSIEYCTIMKWNVISSRSWMDIFLFLEDKKFIISTRTFKIKISAFGRSDLGLNRSELKTNEAKIQ